MKSLYSYILGIIVVAGILATGCGGATPAIPVNASDGTITGAVDVSWENWLEGAPPYTVSRDTSPAMTGAIPVCVGETGTSCTDSTATIDTAYFYAVTGGGKTTPPDGGYHGTLGADIDSVPWRTAITEAREYFKDPSRGGDECPSSSSLPFDECSSPCEGDVGTLSMSGTEVSGTDFFLVITDFNGCKSGDFILTGTFGGLMTSLGAGYVLGPMAYTDTVGSDDGSSYYAATFETLKQSATPTTMYMTTGNAWEFEDLSP